MMLEPYRESLHQASFSAMIDVELAERSPSFRVLARRLRGLLP
jgi:hypothetical protein